MLSKIPERSMHLIRWGLTLGWLLLIISMFYDPVSAVLTAPGQVFAAATPNGCFQFQGECRPLSVYPMGARIFWGMVLPLIILTLLILGHETWRRICPLSFLSQIPRALGWQRQLVIDENSWLGRNALNVQFTLLFIGLNIRLLLVNSDRFLLGIFLLLTILTAITIGFLYDGKTWCNYFCPMAPVHIIYSEPSGLLGSKAHTAPPKSITQSMCRTIDSNGREKSACVACKSGCIDIDAEGSYWETIRQPDRKLLYYGYLGLVIGFYLYFGLYSGNWNLLSAGVWNETNQLSTLTSPGFFIAGRAITIPKLIAVPLTLTLTSGAIYALGLWLEKAYKRYNRKLVRPLRVEQVQSRAFAIAAFLAFNLLFFWGVRPTLGYFPLALQNLLSWLAIVLSSLWLVKTWHRSAHRYGRERDTYLLRRQLSKLEINWSQYLEGRSLDDLKPDELYTLAKVLPSFTQDYRLQIYLGVLQEALEQRKITPDTSLSALQTLRQQLGLSDAAHGKALDQLQQQAPDLFLSPKPIPHPESTILWRLGRRNVDPEATQVRGDVDPDATVVWRDRLPHKK
ncbi:MAG TPA: calcium-binding protein [Coleofasciculaceae cyanobacterium]